MAGDLLDCQRDHRDRQVQPQRNPKLMRQQAAPSKRSTPESSTASKGPGDALLLSPPIPGTIGKNVQPSSLEPKWQPEGRWIFFRVSAVYMCYDVLFWIYLCYVHLCTCSCPRIADENIGLNLPKYYLYTIHTHIYIYIYYIYSNMFVYICTSMYRTRR